MSTPQLFEVADWAAKQLGFGNVKFCGAGAFKETFSVERPHLPAAALKIVDRSKIDVERTKREIAALKRCDSPHIAKVFDTSELTYKGRSFDVIVEEFFDGGTLENRMTEPKLIISDIATLATGLLKAVEALHVQKLVHRDIKPANIMFRRDSNNPVLVDFGIVRDLSKTSLTATWQPHGPGTPFYSAPEQLNNDKHMIDWRTDQFSIGVVLSEILLGKHPYHAKGATGSSTVIAVAERRGPSQEFIDQMKIRMPAVIKMVMPWPVQRYSSPLTVLNALKQ
jgi:serine/threonine protein kinase